MFCNGIFFWKEKSGIQQNLAEHRKNKMAKLQEEQEEEDEEYRLHQPQNYDSYNGNRNSSAYYEEELHNDASPFADPIHDPHQNAFYTPAPPQHNQGFELNAPPVGQYVNNSTTGFSPMPQPQHMPPHPEPTYYNREQQYGNNF
jgi:hypothetical protein